MTPPRTLIAATAFVTSIALAAGCGAVSGAKQAVVGPAEDPGLRRTIIVDPGYQPLNRTLAAADEVVADSARSGHRIRVIVVEGGNASSAREVDLAHVNNGDLRRHARNGPGREEEARRNSEAVALAVQTELAGFSYTGSGADLFGAITRAAHGMPAPDQVVLITGGGVHRTADLDMIRDFQQASRLVGVVPFVSAPDTDLVVLGAADFTGSEPTPTLEFTDAVAALWRQACTAWQLRSCTLAGDPEFLHTLEG